MQIKNDEPISVIYFSFFIVKTVIIITVDAYWKYKFRNVTIPVGEETEMTDLQKQWASNLSIASMVPNVTFLLLNAAVGHKFRAFPRLLAALVVIIVLFIFSDVMTKISTDDWQNEFLGVTLFTVALINIMVAIFQVSKKFQILSLDEFYQIEIMSIHCFMSARFSRANLKKRKFPLAIFVLERALTIVFILH